MPLPTISVVVVNFNGYQHLESCFNSLLKQDYPVDLLEFILIDNGSRDESLSLMKSRFPSIKVIENAENVGFAPAVNQGAAAATGQYLALINNDAYADPHWLKAMVTSLENHRNEGVICVSAKVLDWYGQRIDFAGGGINFYGHGDQFFHQMTVDSVKLTEHEILFPCGGAMLVERELFIQVGGFDPAYFAYLEDVDFGWRLWLYGHKILFTPAAIVYHRHSATSKTVPKYQIRTLLERNALMTIIKNYDEANLQRVLPAALLLLIKKSLLDSRGMLQRQDFDVQLKKANEISEEITVPKEMLSYLVGVGDLIDDFAQLLQKRQAVQSQRVRSDAEILPLFKRPMGINYHSAEYILLQELLTETFGIRSLFSESRATRVLILSSDPLYDNLAGPGIRAVEMARHLAQSCFVRLAAPSQANLTLPNVECVAFQRGDEHTIKQLVNQADVVIIQGFTLRFYPSIRDYHKYLVFDLYDPFHLENLELQSKETIEHAQQISRSDVSVLNEQLLAGDFFICASERQRDFWLGMLSSVNRLSPQIYLNDQTFRSLIDVVPFGMDSNLPTHQKKVLKGIVPNIHEDDLVVLWGGGIWQWLDPLTVIRAMALVREQRQDIKLFFLGYHHPNPIDVPKMAIYDQAVALAQELGLHNQTVFFNDRWVPYQERANYLLESDIGVSAHFEHAETRFAFRTRLLDYIWAGLPMVVSEGDTLADIVTERGLGHVVPINDAERFAQAILTLANPNSGKKTYSQAFGTSQQDFTWSKVLEPLAEFCQKPHYALDKPIHSAKKR